MSTKNGTLWLLATQCSSAAQKCNRGTLRSDDVLSGGTSAVGSDAAGRGGGGGSALIYNSAKSVRSPLVLDSAE